MSNQFYIGYGAQHQQVVKDLAEQIGRTNKGIFVVGGPSRVGKDTAINTILHDRCPVEQVQIVEDNPNKYFFDWNNAYKKGRTLFSCDEIPLHCKAIFNWINRFYMEKRESSLPIQILFNVLASRNPAWKHGLIQKEIDEALTKAFPLDLHLWVLQANPQAVIDELWRLIQEGNSDCYYRAKSLGFDVDTTEFRRAGECENISAFHEAMELIIYGKHQSNPERGF